MGLVWPLKTMFPCLREVLTMTGMIKWLVEAKDPVITLAKPVLAQKQTKKRIRNMMKKNKKTVQGKDKIDLIISHLTRSLES